jgi:DNA-binding NarL/FixJ family response regulator
MNTLVVGSHAFRRRIYALLSEVGKRPNILEANDVADVPLIAGRQNIELTVCEHVLDNSSGRLALLRAAIGKTPIIVVSERVDLGIVRDAVNDGADGFIAGDASDAVTVQAMRLVLAGAIYVPGEILKRRHPLPRSTNTAGEGSGLVHPAVGQLTPRQREVLGLLTQGLSNKEIASRLTLSEGTVKLHVTAILRALKTKSRLKAALVAARPDG